MAWWSAITDPIGDVYGSVVKFGQEAILGKSSVEERIGTANLPAPAPDLSLAAIGGATTTAVTDAAKAAIQYGQTLAGTVTESLGDLGKSVLKKAAPYAIAAGAGLIGLKLLTRR